MADPICVSIAYDVKEKDVFDKKLFNNKNPKPALLEKMKKTIPRCSPKKGL